MKLIPRFDGVVAVSDEILKLVAGVPGIRMEGGVAPEVFAMGTHRPERETFVLAAAGSLDEANGILVILEAFRLLPELRFRLRIAGSGPLDSVVRLAAQLDERIEYLGFLSFADVLDVYSNADVLLNIRPTRALNTRYFFPSKLMEYLASGTPVITTCTGHVEQEFRDFVWLVREETPAELASLIRIVADEPAAARQRKAEQARKYMSENKTWAVQAARVAAFLSNLAVGGRGTRG
jgi:glycosyltransferase involved in cell wall biosynthesis